jgi:hypothetical protein
MREHDVLRRDRPVQFLVELNQVALPLHAFLRTLGEY